MPGLELDKLRGGGPGNSRPGSERLCGATGVVKRVDEMIRFVMGPNEAIVPDLKRRLPGRGLWITATRSALELAIRRNCFARAFKREVVGDADLPAMTDRLLERAALDALGIAHKAGEVALGFASVEAALARSPVAVVLHAREAAPDGVRKLALARERRAGGAPITVVNEFSSAQLDLALGRSNVIHAALLDGRDSRTFLARLAQLHRFRTESMEGLSARDRRGNPASEKAKRGRAVRARPELNGRPRELDRDSNG
jgi:predicted RNA-binding protein YlxR (DUF448 family)